MSGFSKALEADLQDLRPGCPMKGQHMSVLHRDACPHCNPSRSGATMAKALNPLVVVPPEDIQEGVRVALHYARLLNRARILLDTSAADCAECNGKGILKLPAVDRGLQAGDQCPDCKEVKQFLRECHELLGPIVVKR